jgi:hypothetical protein
MKKSWCFLVLGVALASGCVDWPLLQDKPKPPPKPAAAKPARVQPVVTPESVDETNARDKAQSLSEELDRDSESTPAKAKATVAIP